MCRGRHLAVLVLFLAQPALTDAQEISVGVSGLVSFQPVDDFYVGGPYLNAAVGGLAPGIGAAFNVVAPADIVVAAEFSMAWFEQRQYGRLVPGGCTPPASNDCSYVGGSGTTRLHDPILSGLVGYEKGGGRSRAQFLIGAAMLLSSGTFDPDRGQSFGLDDNRSFQMTLTGGVDGVTTLSPRLSFVYGARYTLKRSGHPSLGIGRHILRGGGGVRVRFN